tara:strand:- start:230 stop:553 length:324 start_codon:yes stop_codon:yes gene_type:complete
MKGYLAKKTAKKWSVAKSKVVDVPAVTEVKDEDGKVVRAKVDEKSHDEIMLSKKVYDSETGKALTDSVIAVSSKECDVMIENIDKQITELGEQKSGWEALKADIAKL